MDKNLEEISAEEFELYLLKMSDNEKTSHKAELIIDEMKIYIRYGYKFKYYVDKANYKICYQPYKTKMGFK